MAAVSAPKPVEDKAQEKFPALKFTDNSYVDAVQIIKDGNILALYAKNACRVFHNLKSSVNLSERRVVYFDCNSMPGLLIKGEWDWQIRASIPSVSELPSSDALRQKIIEQGEVPHKVYVTLN